MSFWRPNKMKNPQLPYNIFLDPKRDAKDVTWVNYPPNLTWTPVRTYEDFISMILKHGLPQIISFCHHFTREQEQLEDVALVKGGYNYTGLKTKTGYDCAKWLVKYCFSKKVSLPNTYIHENRGEYGKSNIRKIIVAFRSGLLDNNFDARVQILTNPKITVGDTNIFSFPKPESKQEPVKKIEVTTYEA